jgi:hypothetical protein
MALYVQNGNDTEGRDQKLSGLTKRNTADTEGKGREGKKGIPTVLARRGKRLWVSILVDLILLALVAGLAVGGVFGYRALREMYAPEWEVREVIFRVKMENIPPEMVRLDEEQGDLAIKGQPIWSSESIDADMLGTVQDIRTATVVSEGGEITLNVYLDVKANAYYRKGKGYRMGETMLLAGSTGVYRLEGLAAEGMIISVREAAEIDGTNG